MATTMDAKCSILSCFRTPPPNMIKLLCDSMCNLKARQLGTHQWPHQIAEERSSTVPTLNPGLEAVTSKEHGHLQTTLIHIV